MGYDVEFVRIKVSGKVKFPVESAESGQHLQESIAFGKVADVRGLLLAIEGCREGPENTIDFMGQGLSYARLSVGRKGIHVDNNCSARELLKLFGELKKTFPELLIHDLQSNCLHTAESFTEWWSRPL